MTRKGIGFGKPLLMVFIVFFLAILLVVGVFGSFHIQRSTIQKGSTVYTQNVKPEVIMSAPCATRTKGVFYKSAIQSGKLGCVNLSDSFVGFNWGSCDDGKCAFYRLKAEGGDNKVYAVDRGTVNDVMLAAQRGNFIRRRIPITIYDTETGTRTPAVMQVASR